MNTLQRYIFKQVLLACLMGVGLFAFVLVAGNAMRDVLGLLASGRIGWGLFAQLLFLLLPYVAAYALPVGLLSGVLLVLGRLSAQREITAMKAAGISLYGIVSPIMLIALLGMVFSLFVNFYYAPLARTAYKESMANFLRHDPQQLIKPRAFIKDLPGFILYVDSREGSQLGDFRIWKLDEQNRVTAYIEGKSGSIVYEREEDTLVLTVFDAVAEARDTSDLEAFKDMTLLMPTSSDASFRVPMSQLFGQESVHRKLSMLTLGELLQARTQAKAQEAAGDPEGFSQRITVQFQIQKHFANAYSILSLALFAIPLGIKASRTETYVNVAFAFALAIVYYVAVVVVGWTVKTPALRPDLLIWLPNFVFQAIGFVLLHRASQR